MRKQMTVAVYYDDDKILLAMKKRGFGVDRYNGFGGRVETGETIEECAKREIFEEGGIVVEDLEKRGVVDFEFDGKTGEVLEVNFFRILKYTGLPRETDEMRPEWFKVDSLPYEKMFPADRVIFPYLLGGQKFSGRVLYNQSLDAIVEKDIRVVDSLE